MKGGLKKMKKPKVELQEQMLQEELPQGIFQQTNNSNVFIDNFGRLFVLEYNKTLGIHKLIQLTELPNSE